jgi:hypothetical protein
MTVTRRFADVVVKVCWIGAVAGAALGAFVGYVAIASASGAPQEAAGAAIGCLTVIAPYVFARSVQELLRD